MEAYAGSVQVVWHLLGINKRPTPISVMQASVGKSRIAALHRREVGLSFAKKTNWSEADVAALPSGEHDYFERKAGALIEGDRNSLLATFRRKIHLSRIEGTYAGKTTPRRRYRRGVS
jgi:hypothetical protein